MKNHKENFQITYSLKTIPIAVSALYQLLPICSVFTFTGSLGAGKTTLIKHLLTQCGITDVIVSPTFNYVVSYTNNQGQRFYHFDLYRMKSIHDFIDQGFNELLYEADSWSFIEWPEIIAPLLTKKVCNVFLDYYDEQRIMEYNIT